MTAAAILIGRKGSRLKNKNTRPILDRPLCSYPMMAAKASKHVQDLYVSTDCENIQSIATDFQAELIQRPPEMATNDALAEDVFKMCFEQIEKSKSYNYYVLLFANAATIRPGVIDEGIETLEKSTNYDSAVTVSPYNMFSPLRAKKIEDGYVRPSLSLNHFPGATCDRDSAGQTYFADCSAFIVRPRCFDYNQGELPFRWIGKEVAPLHQEVGFDVDHEWQFSATEYALKTFGFTNSKTPYST